MIGGDEPEPRGQGRAGARARLLAEGLLIGAVALTINLAGNARTGLWDRDEPRYAVAVREMKARGDWVVPTFNGEPRYHKPILAYWIMGLGTAIGGDNPFGARLGSATAGAATCLVVWWLGRRMFSPAVGVLGACVLATAPLMAVESKLATTDAILLLFLTVAQACLWSLQSRDSRSAALGFWLAIALALLTKGPVGPSLIAAAGLAGWWLRGPTAAWARLRWRWGLAMTLALTLPWFIAVGLRSGGGFFRFAAGVQGLQRLTTTVEDHGAFPGYYAIGTMLGFYPWSALLPLALLGAWAGRKCSPDLGFLLGWVVGPWIVLESIPTKLIHYYLPAIPGLALLVAWRLVEAAGDVATLRRYALGRLAIGSLGGIGVSLTAAAAAAAFVLPSAFRAPFLTMAAIGGVGTLATIHGFQRGRPLLAAGWVATTSALTMVVATGWLLPRAESSRLSRIVGEKLGRLAEAERAEPVLVTYQEPGVIYALGRTASEVHNWDELVDLAERHRALITAVTPGQLLSLRWDGRFEVEVMESLDGFNLSKGKVEPLRLARLRRKPATSDDRLARQ